MATPKIFESEYRFCLILWQNEPVTGSALAKLCKEELGWSRTTTYTVIKRLGDRGIVRVENSVVSSLVSKEEAQIAQMDEMLEKTFEGSIPAFITAFAKREKLSEKDLSEIRKIIDGTA
ncbi:MAG: BlaI/MecI/CopY family transcriptional regulator [Lachnospiraceae bacterium]|nr:BlaI/MecI/CopY family transcriptional regulator [Lachnospiraceae bacterium]